MWPLFKAVNLIYLLVSGYAWFGFLLPGNIIPALVSVFMVVCFAFGNFNLKFTPRVYSLLGILLLYFLYSTFILGIPYGIIQLTSYFPAILIFMLEPAKQLDLLKYITRWIGILLIIDLIGFGLTFFISLPHSDFVPAGMEDHYGVYENYLLFIKRTAFETNAFTIVRFSGPFIEPGHLSMVCGTLLFANRYRTKENPLLWVYIIAILISLSLAGYVILLAGILLCRVKNIYTVIISLAFGVGIWAVFAYGWNSGNNPVNKMIFERLEYDEDKGIKGNNRTLIQTDYYFNHSIQDGTFWLGVRSQKEQKLKIRGAGYKIFILKYGIVAVAFVAWIYLLLIAPKSNKRYAISFFILIVMLFLQRAYPWAYSWLLPYVLGIGITHGKSFNELNFKNTEDQEDLDKPDIEDDQAVEITTSDVIEK